MANLPLTPSRQANTYDNKGEDHLYTGDDTQNYLGHEKAVYGFILFTPSDLNGKEFIFPFPPQSIEQDEESAITITPTQGGGKFIENQGNIFKDIIISGTTGFLPLKAMRNTANTALLQQSLARLTGAADVSAKAAFAKVSGYDSFMRLRSLIREYLQIHRTASVEDRRQTLLYWINQKDKEVWLVEPLRFRTSRTSRSSMTYMYNITLRTIAKGAVTFTKPPDQVSVGNIASLLSSVRSGITSLRDRIDGAVALVNGSLKFFDTYRNLRSSVISILDVGSQVSAALTKIGSGVADVIDLPRSVILAASTNITNVFQSILDAADLIATAPLDAYEGLTTLRQQFDFVQAQPSLFTRKWQTAWTDTVSKFNTEYGVSGSASAALTSGATRGSIKQATPNQGETVFNFAARVTGDAMRAQEIIVLNNLRWPYFSASAEERAPGTVAPGDSVLVPSDVSNDANNNLISTSPRTNDKTYKDEVSLATSTVLTKTSVDLWRVNQWVGYTMELLSGLGAGQTRLVLSNTTTTLTLDVPLTTTPSSPDLFSLYFKRVTTVTQPGLLELLGVDLRIKLNPTTGTWDLQQDSNGDYSVVKGQENLNQALSIKFLTTQGDLILHPWFGLRPVFGQRGSPEALFRLRLFFEQTLLSDSRIESVESLTITQTNDQYRTEARLAVKGGLRSLFASPLI